MLSLMPSNKRGLAAILFQFPHSLPKPSNPQQKNCAAWIEYHQAAQENQDTITHIMGRAVIYCRVSTEEQAQNNLSLPSQRKICLEWCQRNGYDVAQVFIEEGESAKTADRTQLKNLLKFCREKKDIEVVIVARLDRWARNANDHGNLRTVLAACGVTLRSATEAIDDTSTGKFMETVLSAVAQLDNDIRADRSVKGMKERLERGQWTFPPPLGYIAGKTHSGEKTLLHDSKRAPLVREAFEMYTEGIYSKQQVLRAVTLKGLRTNAEKSCRPNLFSSYSKSPCTLAGSPFQSGISSAVALSSLW
jgi:DNA invertase Pin-like site-specific DNA recombinase